MGNQTSGKKLIIFLSIALVIALLFGTSYSGAQPKTYTVQKGDTLWDLCQKFYGDANLWPKLWEMNPFVTNPHLLKPGDVLTLFEKEATGKEEMVKPPEKAAPPVPEMKGVDISGLTQPEAMGYFSTIPVEGWGFVEATTSAKIGLDVGETAFVKFEKNADTIHVGQEFAIVTSSSLIRHPLTDQPLGYIVSTRGKLVIKEHLRGSHFRAEVSSVYSEVGVGSLVMPATPYSPCIIPMSTDPKLYGNIIGLKENQEMFGQFSVVYLDAGFKDGVKRGSVFDLIKIIRTPSVDFGKESFGKAASEVVDKLSKETYLADFWQKLQEGEKLYEDSVGKIMVVEARPDTSTAVVLKASRDLSRGAFVKGVSWTELPDYIASLPSCSSE
jgi:LysM repeat protein